MIFEDIVNKIKLKMNNNKLAKDPKYINTKELYVCVISMIGDLRRTSLTGFDYILTSSECIIARKSEDGKYINVFENATYEIEKNIKPRIGDFCVVLKKPIIIKQGHVTKEELKLYLDYYKLLCVEDHFGNDIDTYSRYDCGPDEVAATCHVCGNTEYEGSLVNVNTYPVCNECFNKYREKGNIKKRTNNHL